MDSPRLASPAPDRGLAHLIRWWATSVERTVDHGAVLRRIREDSGWSAHYAFMAVMSAGIAVLGLLLSSPAVVIGAMLISPLMGPIIGLGFALATFDSHWLRRSLTAMLAGVILATAFCALIVWFSPLQTVTDEIAQRTRPNLFDLLVALFSGLAGTYAMIRGRHGAIVGVAIATALMPPLAVVGYGLATRNWTVLAGSSLLFFTNLMTIAASAAVLARLYRFAPGLSPNQTRVQALLVIVCLVALAIPLGFSLKQIAWEAFVSRKARESIESTFNSDARVSELDVDFHSDPIEVSATVLTRRIDGAAQGRLQAALASAFGQPIDIAIDQVLVGRGNSEAAELAAARSGLGGGAARQPDRIGDRLALAAGVRADQVMIDTAHRRAQVVSEALPGASLATYRALEQRIAGQTPGWTIWLVPVAAPLPEIGFERGEPTAEGAAALDTAAWAAKRLRLPLVVTARNAADSAKVVTSLADRGVSARAASGAAPADAVRLSWAAPGAVAQEGQ